MVKIDTGWTKNEGINLRLQTYSFHILTIQISPNFALTKYTLDIRLRLRIKGTLVYYKNKRVDI